MTEAAAGTALERRDDQGPARPLPAMTDGELAPLYRTARALAESGMFKDSTQPGQAFAKILAGRDLGLTPFEAMAGLHVIEGKIEASSDLHATRVRQAPGLGFRVAWIKIDGPPEQQDGPPKVEAVWADEEALDDLRETYGCAVVFYDSVPEGGRAQDGQQRGVSRFTVADAVRAELTADRGTKTSNHVKYPRNMFYARAMTNGVAWFVPEVMGGVRVYGHGEIPRDTGEDLTAGDPRTTPTVQAAKSLPTEVEAIVARARELGHAGLANREAWAMRVGGDQARLATALKQATGELNRMAQGKPTEAPKPVADVESTAEPVDGALADAFDAPDGDVAAEARKVMGERLVEIRDRIARAGEDPEFMPDDVADLEAEADGLEAQLGALGDPAQTDLGIG